MQISIRQVHRKKDSTCAHVIQNLGYGGRALTKTLCLLHGDTQQKDDQEDVEKWPVSVCGCRTDAKKKNKNTLNYD